jgi:predicted RNase H-like HicB family nuclease
LNGALKQAGLKKQEQRQMRYLVAVEKGSTSFGAYMPDLPGCIAAGETRDEVLVSIQETIEFHLEGSKEDGAPIPPPSSSSKVEEVAA